MNWEEFLKREDIIGGDIETCEDGVAYRGPIQKIEVRGDCIYFILAWAAREDESGNWKKWHLNTCFVNMKEVSPEERKDGCIAFRMPYLGDAIIFPKGKDNLDPKLVEGLIEKIQPPRVTWALKKRSPMKH